MLDWLGAYHAPVILLPGQRRAELVGAYLASRTLRGAMIWQRREPIRC